MAPIGVVGQLLRSGGRSSIHNGSFTARTIARAAARTGTSGRPSAYPRVTLISHQARSVATGSSDVANPSKDTPRGPLRQKSKENSKAPVKNLHRDLVMSNALENAGKLSNVTFEDGRLELKYEKKAEAIPVSKLWLRDSCECEHCVTPSSGQKRFRTSDLPANPAVKAASVANDGTLSIEWDGEVTDSGAPHVSAFSSQFLLREFVHKRPTGGSTLPYRRMWDRASIERDLRPVAYSDWVSGNEEFWRGLLDLYQMGLLIVDGVPETDTGVVQVANAIGHVQTTFYGDTFDVVSKPQAENVAYTNVFLCLHQDLMYMLDPPYIQLLHCLHNECDGGESLFSDSIRAAWEVTLKYPEHAKVLARYKVPYHYERQGNYYFNRRPVFEMARSGYIHDTAWSPPFQDAFQAAPTLTKESGEYEVSPDLEQWREAAQIFSDLIESPENQYEVKMKPGQCVLFNNRRSLHGRNMFNTSQGSRHLKGTYISEQVFTSKVMSMIRENKYAPATASPPYITATDRRIQELAQVARLLEDKNAADPAAPTA